MIARHGLTPGNHYRLTNTILFHFTCNNEKVTEGIIQCLLEYFPDAASSVDGHGNFPLHYACGNKSATLGIIQLIVDKAPDSVRSADGGEDKTPLHYLCQNKHVDEANALEILNLLMEKYLEAVRDATGRWELPIHHASRARSPQFCCVLIEAYPGSVRMPDGGGELPLHLACFNGSLATVEYLYRQYPDAIAYATTRGFNWGHYPIHFIIRFT